MRSTSQKQFNVLAIIFRLELRRLLSEFKVALLRIKPQIRV
jgi:hypothetical protein